MEEDNMTTKTVCKVCGRRARRRCPALGAYSCTRCCGSRRGPDFGCSGDCEFYPFGIAGYDLWLRLYDALIPRIVKRVAVETDEIHMESLVRSFDAVAEMYGENPDAPAFLAGLLEGLAVMPGERMRAIFKNMDSYHCVATYDIADRGEGVRRVLEAKPDFEWDDREPEEGDPPEVEYYIWSRVGESREIEKDMAPHFRHEPGSEWVGRVGNIKLYDDKLVFEAFTKQLYGLGKKMLERHFGKLVRFVDEEISEVAGAIADAYEDEDYAGGPEPGDLTPDAIAPEVRIAVMTKFYEERYARFLDEEIPALGGMTPREASARPEARPMLIELMKEHIHGIDRMNREESTDISLNSLLEELGLDELIA
jgi:hypothetical protein